MANSALIRPVTLNTPPIRLAIVTNIPAPYRIPVYDLMARDSGFILRVFYAARIEPDRRWDLPALQHDHVFLDGSMMERGGRFIHVNTDIWGYLNAFQPDVVLTTGYNPTHLFAWLHALLHRKHHVVMTDGTQLSEAGLSWKHRAIRRLVLRSSAAFVAASHGGWRLLRGYGASPERIHFSPLCANTTVQWDAPVDFADRDVDLLFSGRLVDVKNGQFALQIAAEAGKRLGRQLRLVVLGSGPLEAALRRQAQALEAHLQVDFAGHVDQKDIPRWFARARLFLFPTRYDPWGVVANEACLAAVPVLASPHAGASGEIVIDHVSGRVLPLVAEAWVEACCTILQDPALHMLLATGAREAVAPYSFDNAAAGMLDAARQAAVSTVSQGPTPRGSTFIRHPRVVVAVQQVLTPAWLALFEALKIRLRAEHVELIVLHDGAADAPDRATADLVIVADSDPLTRGFARWRQRRPARLAIWEQNPSQGAEHRGLRGLWSRLSRPHADWWFVSDDRTGPPCRPAGRVTVVCHSPDDPGGQDPALHPATVERSAPSATHAMAARWAAGIEAALKLPLR